MTGREAAAAGTNEGEKMALKDPYRVHRQMHLGDFLDQLQLEKMLTWSWGYENKRALFNITEPAGSRVTYQIKDAEAVALRIARREGIPWIPVPNPGNIDLYQETQAKIALLKQTAKPSEYSNE